ncbi:MAG: shikimate kinase [Flavobacterium sp.]|nr:MAG: shikimate kinase [Flavobacterium sp.]
MKKVILAGYMGSGKSATAQILQQITGFELINLDRLIEQKAGLSVNDIFKKKGEMYFRKLEHESLKDCLVLDQNAILDLGGGTPCYYNNMKLILASDTISFYLKTSIATLQSRLDREHFSRPLLKNCSSLELTEFIAKHLFERRPYYEMCNHTVTTDDKSPALIADAIASILREEGVIPVS